MFNNPESDIVPKKIEYTFEEYLNRLPDIDQKNVKKLVDTFIKAATLQDREAYLIAVGGALYKPIPRPDYDMLVVLHNKQDEPKEDQFDFSRIDSFINNMTQLEPELVEIDRIEPFPDPDIPSVIRHEGSVKMHFRNGGTPFEFIRAYNQREKIGKNNMEYFKNRPYAILSVVNNKERNTLSL